MKWKCGHNWRQTDRRSDELLDLLELLFATKNYHILVRLSVEYPEAGTGEAEESAELVRAMAGELDGCQWVEAWDQVEELWLEDDILLYVTLEEEAGEAGETVPLLEDGWEAGLVDLQHSQPGEEDDLQTQGLARHQTPGYLLRAKCSSLFTFHWFIFVNHIKIWRG